MASDGQELPIHGSHLQRLSGLGWLSLLVLVGFVFAMFGGFLLEDRDGVGQWLAIAGSALMLPGGVFAFWVFGVIGLRMLRPRSAKLVLSEDQVVIHDNWLLRIPVVIDRADIASIDGVKPPGLWRRSTFAAPVTDTVVLDWGYRFNVQIRLHHRRRFVEAIRTPPSDGAYRVISTNGISSSLLLRIEDEHDRAALRRWHMAGPRSERTRRRGQRPAPRRGVSGALFAFAGFIGFCMACLGFYLGSS